MTLRLTEEQRAILADLRGPLRIEAGAGTGKTDTLRLAIVELIRQGVRPGSLLCLTFTVEATKEMRRRVLAEFEGRTDIDPDELTVQTYHAFAASIVREHAPLLGLEGDPALLDRARAWQLALETLDRCRFDRLEIGWLPSFVVRLTTLTEELQRHVVPVDRAREWCRTHAGDEVSAQRLDALDAVETYTRVKRERNAIDFGDQIVLAIELLRSRPDVLEGLRRRFRYLVLDEYQDTDVAQRELVRLLGEGAQLVCAVGDVDQGIFGWRGATIFNMFSFPDDFPGTRTETLSTNFRSGQRILDLANALIDPYVRPRGEVRAPLREAPGAQAAAVEGFVTGHQLDEADEIARLIAEGGEPWSQYAVLSRTRGLFDPIFRALAARGVPAEVDLLGGFWTRPEILDALSWLRLLANPADNLSLARLLLGPAYHLGRRDLFFLADKAREGNRRLRYGSDDVLPYALIDEIVAHGEIPELSDEARERVGALRATWLELSRIAARVSLADLVGEVARVSGLAAELAGSPDPEAALALRHLAKLRDLAQGYQPVAGSGELAGFVDYLDSIDESDQDEDELRAAEPNAARLMTLHRAKGLEWDVVFIPGLTDGHMPHPGKGGNDPTRFWYRLPFELRGDREFLPPQTEAGIKELRDEEERRLMYVGVTRARRRLVLSRAWFYRDNLGVKQPSPYWKEAVATGLVALRDSPCPPVNPHPLGIEAPPEPERRFVPPPADPAEIARISAELERLRAVEAVRPRAAAWRPPSTISVTALLTFIRDEEEFFWRYVRRVPSPPSPAARLGLDLHRRIEQHARGRVSLGGGVEDPEDAYDLDPGERRGDGTRVSADELWENFLASRFAETEPLMTEQPFTLYLGHGLSVEGRIDAVFERPDGVWEVVDYKTGSSDPDPLQLAIYARAVEEIWGKRAEPRWLLLRDGREESPAPVDSLGDILERAARELTSLS